MVFWWHTSGFWWHTSGFLIGHKTIVAPRYKNHRHRTAVNSPIVPQPGDIIALKYAKRGALKAIRGRGGQGRGDRAEVEQRPTADSSWLHEAWALPGYI